MPTAVVSLGSDLERRKWVREDLLQAASKSFWNPFTGNTKDSVVYQRKDTNASEGHTVVFDFSGNLSKRAIKGKDTAFGQGEQKKKFSDKIVVDRYRFPVDNGDSFDGVNIGDLSINEHADSRTKLADLFVRFKDQSIFDAGQGNLVRSPAPTHIIDLGTTFTYNTLLDIEKFIKTSSGFTTGGKRRPLDAYVMQDGRPIWLFVMDTAMANIIKQDTAFQTIMRSADVRGNDNRLIKGVLAKIGQMLIVEADNFFGVTELTAAGWDLDDSDIEISGLRQYDGADPLTAPWTGQVGFDLASTDLHSRALIMGAGAIQLGFGKMPDYRFQESQDFAITSESVLEVWMETQKTNMVAEDQDYVEAKVAGIDWGVIAVDLEVQ